MWTAMAPRLHAPPAHPTSVCEMKVEAVSSVPDDGEPPKPPKSHTKYRVNGAILGTEEARGAPRGDLSTVKLCGL